MNENEAPPSCSFRFDSWTYERTSGMRVSVAHPTNKLILKIRSWLEPGVRTIWSDRLGRTLEDQLNDVLKGFLVASGVLQRWRIERQEEEHRRRAAELERLRREQREREEAKRTGALFEQVDCWRQAANIRAH